MYKPTIRFDSEGIAHVTEEGIRKGVSVVWVDNPRNSGGQYQTDWFPYPFRIVLHEIQGGASYGNIARHPYPPHVWYDSTRRILFQTVPLGRSAYALYQSPTAPHYTNKACALQVELTGITEGIANEPQEVLDNIAEDVVVPLCVWADTKNSPIDLSDLPEYPWVIANSAREDAPQRYTVNRWCVTRGMLTHANVPMGDDHWDTGAMNIVWIAQHAALCIGAILEGQDPFPQPKEQENMPGSILQMSDRTIIGSFNNGTFRRLTGPEFDMYRPLVPVVVHDENWTLWFRENVWNY